jgi:hypothetical protein
MKVFNICFPFSKLIELNNISKGFTNTNKNQSQAQPEQNNIRSDRSYSDKFSQNFVSNFQNVYFTNP